MSVTVKTLSVLKDSATGISLQTEISFSKALFA
jgi:hypothetical protein